MLEYPHYYHLSRIRTDFRLLVPAGHEIENTGEEASLNASKKESHGQHTLIVLGDRHTGAYGAPDDHQAWKIV